MLFVCLFEAKPHSVAQGGLELTCSPGYPQTHGNSCVSASECWNCRHKPSGSVFLSRKSQLYYHFLKVGLFVLCCLRSFYLTEWLIKMWTPETLKVLRIDCLQHVQRSRTQNSLSDPSLYARVLAVHFTQMNGHIGLSVLNCPWEGGGIQLGLEEGSQKVGNRQAFEDGGS